jgi:uncharacterized protein
MARPGARDRARGRRAGRRLIVRSTVRGAKPLDAGTGRLCASFDPVSAAWLSLGAPHERVGFVELSALPPFDERRRGDPAAARAHRQAMTSGAHAFLAVEIDGRPPVLRPDPIGPRWTSSLAEVEVEAAPDASVIRQRWTVTSDGAAPPSVRVRVAGDLDRPALAEITELDPAPPTGATTTLTVRDGAVVLEAPRLPASVTVAVSGTAVGWRATPDGCLATLTWPGDARVARFAIEAGVRPVAGGRDPLDAAHGDGGDPLTDRALAYVRGCTALRTAPDERVILTDHRILPLSWTRDAYWQALAMLAADGHGDRQRVSDHLRWLWRRCERPDGRWVRSHHANGRRKDLAFQADQQLYPIVELADLWRLSGSLPEGVAWTSEVASAWSAALAEVDQKTGFIASAENAADDPATLPYIVASQVLLWYAALRLAEVAETVDVGIGAEDLLDVARRLRGAFDALVVDPGAPWPYALDTAGGRFAYQDANDLPVALAPLWGFCAADDPGWLATMAFAFGPQNPGWAGGRLPGLGSAHTPGAWTLGDVQAWISARARDDEAAADRAMRRIEAVAFADGMLPEAYATDDAEPVRHWFAWPGAALAALRVLDRDSRLKTALAVRGSG